MWNLQPMLLNHCQHCLTKKTIIVPVWFYLHCITSIRIFQRPVRMKAHRTKTTRMVRDLKFKIKKMYPISQCALWRLISFLLRNRIIHEWFTNLNSNKEKIKKLSSISPKLKIVRQDDWEEINGDIFYYYAKMAEAITRIPHIHLGKIFR